jgi:hypothetical protein
MGIGRVARRVRRGPEKVGDRLGWQEWLRKEMGRERARPIGARVGVVRVMALIRSWRR